MTQKEMILHMLTEGRTVTKLTTLPLGIGNLADVVLRLRHDGHTIDTVKRTDITGRPFAGYELATG